MNSVQLIGRLTRDPELRYASGSEPLAVARFSLAVSDGYGDKKKTSYISIVVFGKQAENCEKYLKKGHRAGITGKLQTGSYMKDDIKIYTTDVIAQSIEFLEPKKKTEAKADGFDGFEPVEDDIPF